MIEGARRVIRPDHQGRCFGAVQMVMPYSSAPAWSTPHAAGPFVSATPEKSPAYQIEARPSPSLVLRSKSLLCGWGTHFDAETGPRWTPVQGNFHPLTSGCTKHAIRQGWGAFGHLGQASPTILTQNMASIQLARDRLQGIAEVPRYRSSLFVDIKLLISARGTCQSINGASRRCGCHIRSGSALKARTSTVSCLVNSMASALTARGPDWDAGYVRRGWRRTLPPHGA